MSDFQRKIQKFLLAPSDVFVAGDGLTGQEREIAETIAMAKAKAVGEGGASPGELAEVISDLATHPKVVLGEVNLAAILRYADQHILNNPFEMSHFHWKKNGEERVDFAGGENARFGEGTLELRPLKGQWVVHYVSDHETGWSCWGSPAPTPEMALKICTSSVMYIQPKTAFAGYARWIKAGYKPSQFGLLPPEQLHRALEFTEVVYLPKGEDSFPSYIPIIELPVDPSEGHNRYLTPMQARFCINYNFFPQIGITLPLNSSSYDLNAYVQKALREAWDFYAGQEHCYTTRVPKNTHRKVIDLLA